MYNQSYAIHLKVMTLKKMNKFSKDYICIYNLFFKKEFHLNLAMPKWTKMLH